MMLGKFAPFDESRHPRDTGGKFTSAPSMAGGRPAPVVVRPDPKRSLTRGESWQRTGTKVAAIPPEYTGSPDREAPVGSFKHIQLTRQLPKLVDPKTDEKLTRGLIEIMKTERLPTVVRAHESGLIPDGTSRRTINRAYNHAAMLALHDFGTRDYQFSMDDDLKQELEPLKGFMLYARRRVKSQMLGTHKGAWRPYRAEFGVPFADRRLDRQTGQVRLRTRPNQELIKSAPKLIKSSLFGMPSEQRSFRISRRATGEIGAFRLNRRATGALGGLGRLPRVRVIHFIPKEPKLGKAMGAARIDPTPQSLGIQAPQQGQSRWDQWRRSIATGENLGGHDMLPLSIGQRMERKRAGIAERLKVRSGAPKLSPGMLGSISGIGIGHRDYVSTDTSVTPKVAAPKVPGARSAPSGEVTSGTSLGLKPKRNLGNVAPQLRGLSPGLLGKRHDPLLREMVPAHAHSFVFPKQKAPVAKKVVPVLAEAHAILAHATRKLDPAPKRHARSHGVADPTRPLHHVIKA